MNPARTSAVAAWVAIAPVLALALAACAVETGRKADSTLEAAPYVGVFTGEFVEGRPLYRFPSILVVGSRHGSTPTPD